MCAAIIALLIIFFIIIVINKNILNRKGPAEKYVHTASTV